MQMQQAVEEETENNLSSLFTYVLNAESGIMQPAILFLSYVTEILKISQDNVTRDEVPIAMSQAYACLLSTSKDYTRLLNISKV